MTLSLVMCKRQLHLKNPVLASAPFMFYHKLTAACGWSGNEPCDSVGVATLLSMLPALLLSWSLMAASLVLVDVAIQYTPSTHQTQQSTLFRLSTHLFACSDIGGCHVQIDALV